MIFAKYRYNESVLKKCFLFFIRLGIFKLFDLHYVNRIIIFAIKYDKT